MKAAIIGASEESLHTIEKAKEAGLQVIAVDGNPQAAGLKVADKGYTVDISNPDAVIDKMRAEKIDFVLTVPIGRYLTTIGAVNDALGLLGLSEQGALNCTDKYLFHQLLAENRLRNCACFLSKESDISVNYPAIAKPRFGSGSRGIYYLKDQEDLNNFEEEIKEAGEDYLVEETLPGDEYGVDAIIEGETPHLILLRRKIQTPLPARQAVAYISVVPQDETELYERVKTYMNKTVKVLQLENCLLHADLMISQKEVAAIEVSARPSGHNLHNLFTPLATGIDMAQEYIHYLCGKAYQFETDTVHKMMIHYFDLQGQVLEVPLKGEIQKLLQEKNIELIDWNCNIKSEQILEAVTTGHSLMGRGYFILKGSDEAALIEASKDVLNSFQLKKKSVAIITARGGSKRLPGKNYKEFCGKPILCYSIEAALNSGVFDEVMVSTDSEEIASIANQAGAKVPFMRSQENAGDYASTDAVIMEVLQEYQKRGITFESFCCIYPTAPFVTGDKLTQAMKLLETADSVMPVVKFSYPPQRGVVVNDGKIIRKYPQYINTRSQDLEPMYHDCGQFYACKYLPFMREKTTDVENLVPMVMPELEVQDIDTIEDWQIAELKYKQMIEMIHREG